MKKMVTTILIITVCLAANIVVSAEFVTGEMSLSQASETYGGGCGCCDLTEPTCPSHCDAGTYFGIALTESGFENCSAAGNNGCGGCFGYESGHFATVDCG